MEYLTMIVTCCGHRVYTFTFAPCPNLVMKGEGWKISFYVIIT